MDDGNNSERSLSRIKRDEVGVNAPEPDRGIVGEIFADVTHFRLLGQETECLPELLKDMLCGLEAAPL